MTEPIPSGQVALGSCDDVVALPLTEDSSQIAIELRLRPQWVTWLREGGKTPYVADEPRKRANIVDPSDWRTFDVATEAYTQSQESGNVPPLSGVGFVLCEGGGIVGIDLDGCRDATTGAITTWAQIILQGFHATYAEVSPSGTGVKIFALGQIPKGARQTRKLYSERHCGVEVYERARYFAVTGIRLDPHPASLSQSQPQIDWLFRDHLGWEEEAPCEASNKSKSPYETDVNTIKDLAQGREFELLVHFGFPRQILNGGQHPCPRCGGHDRCALRDRGRGAIGCRKCFDRECGDFIGSIGWLNRWALPETLRHIADYLGYKAAPTSPAPRFDDKVESTQAMRPVVVLPGDSQTISAAGAELGQLFSDTGRYFLRGNEVVRAVRDGREIRLENLAPAQARSAFEEVATLHHLRRVRNGDFEPKPGICSESDAKAILTSEAFKARLPPISMVSCCPVLVEQEGELILVSDYDRKTGILASNLPVEDVPIEQAVLLLRGLMDDFDFVDATDLSRALGAMITPALVFGGHLGHGRAPIDASEANQSQAGKGFRGKLVAAIYGTQSQAITQTGRGVGSLQESFSAAALAARPIITLDNLKGMVNESWLESYMTEPLFSARTAYSKNMSVPTTRTVIQMTTNKGEMTPDLANRCSVVRIRKRPDGYPFKSYSSDPSRFVGVLEHVMANQGLYLGAVFAIVRHWHAAGKPARSRVAHDFLEWARIVGWIVENIFGAAPLDDGHREIQRRVANPALNWLRDIALAVLARGNEGQWLRTFQLLDVVREAGIKIEGIPECDDGVDDGTASHKKACQALGRVLGRALVGEDSVSIDGVQVTRRQGRDLGGRPSPEYQFARNTPLPDGGGGTFPNSPKSGRTL